MKANCRCRGIVNEGFEELALALGGVNASYDLADEAVWDLARAMDLTCERIQAKLARTGAVSGQGDLPESDGCHPAVAHLLQRLKAAGEDQGGNHAKS